MSVQQSIHLLQEAMGKENILAQNGLGDDLFLFASTLMPVINVDLLVLDHQGNILLSWRDDAHCGRGWHIPGGCIRFRETIRERVEKTALQELGCKVQFNPDVFHVFEIFSSTSRDIQNAQERAHFITLVIPCRTEEGFSLEQQTKKPGEAGYLQWFPCLPDNLLAIQNCYREQWAIIQNKLKGRY